MTNISKAGCFVAIGHNTSVRIGLNELDDSENFDFQRQLPLGRQVCGRITRVMDTPEGLRFNASLRRSLVTYGVHSVNKNTLKAGQQFAVFVLAVAQEQVFGQIKGSYLKVTVKGCPKGTAIGSLVEVNLTKVFNVDIKAEYVGKCDAVMAEGEETARHVYDSVISEA